MTEQGDIRSRIEKLVRTLMNLGVAREDTIRGCSDREIEEVEADVGRRLPFAYREFLARIGRGAGAFYLGTDIFYPRPIGMTEAARALVAEDPAGIALPQDAITFAMHQGYNFMFVRAEEGDDPPVYFYMEHSGQFVKKADQLSQFFIDVALCAW